MYNYGKLQENTEEAESHETAENDRQSFGLNKVPPRQSHPQNCTHHYTSLRWVFLICGIIWIIVAIGLFANMRIQVDKAKENLLHQTSEWNKTIQQLIYENGQLQMQYEREVNRSVQISRLTAKLENNYGILVNTTTVLQKNNGALKQQLKEMNQSREIALLISNLEKTNQNLEVKTKSLNSNSANMLEKLQQTTTNNNNLENVTNVLQNQVNFMEKNFTLSDKINSLLIEHAVLKELFMIQMNTTDYLENKINYDVQMDLDLCEQIVIATKNVTNKMSKEKKEIKTTLLMQQNKRVQMEQLVDTLQNDTQNISAELDLEEELQRSRTTQPPSLPGISETTVSPQPSSCSVPLRCGFSGTIPATCQSIVIQSPGYPHYYRSSTVCRWQIRAKTSSSKIKLTFVVFKTESNYDYLLISEGGGEIRRFSGTILIPPVYVSITNSLDLFFRTDASVHYIGFKANVQEIP